MAAISALIAAGTAVAGIGSAAIGASATKKAAKAQTDAATTNNALQERIYNENRNLLAPDIAAGRDASSLLSDFLGVSGDGARAQTALDTFLKSTGYQEATSRGTEAIVGNRAAAGVLGSGATLKDVNDYGRTQALSYADRWLNLLSDRAGAGERAASAATGVATNYAGAVSNNNQNAADARSNAALQNGSIWSNALSGVAGAAGRYMGASSFNKNGAVTVGNPLSVDVPEAQTVQQSYPFLTRPNPSF
jgi:hypothetical protein